MSEELRKTIMDAMRSVSERADEFKAGCAMFDGEWPDAEDKAIYDAEVALVERLRVALAALPSDTAQAPIGEKTASVLRLCVRELRDWMSDYGQDIRSQEAIQRANALLAAQSTVAPQAAGDAAQAPTGPRSLTRDAIQSKALEHGFEYWRAPDAHGVTGTKPQCIDLLQDLLGVEVEIQDNGCQVCNGTGVIGGPSYYAPDEGEVPCECCAAPVIPAAAAPSDTCAHDYLRSDRVCVECGEKAAKPDERAAFDGQLLALAREFANKYSGASNANQLQAEIDFCKALREFKPRATAPQATVQVPSGLSREEKRELILGVAQATVKGDETQDPTKELLTKYWTPGIGNTLTNVTQILDVVRQEWSAQGCWSEWDQSVRDDITAILSTINATDRAAVPQAGAPNDAAITACALMIKGICMTLPQDQWSRKIEERIHFMLSSQAEK